jgi:transcriptional regulator with XRE-family HTH domain
MAALGMSSSQMAAYLRVTPGAVGRWLRGERAIPGPVARLVEMALAQLQAGA